MEKELKKKKFKESILLSTTFFIFGFAFLLATFGQTFNFINIKNTADLEQFTFEIRKYGLENIKLYLSNYGLIFIISIILILLSIYGFIHSIIKYKKK